MAKARPSHLVAGKVDVGACFEGPSLRSTLLKQRALQKVADPELRHRSSLGTKGNSKSSLRSIFSELKVMFHTTRS